MVELVSIYDSISEVFHKKSKDYGTSWRSLRPLSINDQLLIKTNRLRTLQQPNYVPKVNESQEECFIGLFNYSVMAIIINRYGISNDTNDVTSVTKHYPNIVDEAFGIACAKNQDYGSAWKELSVETITDLIHQKLLRSKQIIKNDGVVTVSEPLEASYIDIINYSVFALHHLGFGEALKEDVITKKELDEMVVGSDLPPKPLTTAERIEKMKQNKFEIEEALRIDELKNLGTFPISDEQEKQWSETVSEIFSEIENESTVYIDPKQICFDIDKANQELFNELNQENSLEVNFDEKSGTINVELGKPVSDNITPNTFSSPIKELPKTHGMILDKKDISVTMVFEDWCQKAGIELGDTPTSEKEDFLKKIVDIPQAPEEPLFKNELSTMEEKQGFLDSNIRPSLATVAEAITPENRASIEHVLDAVSELMRTSEYLKLYNGDINLDDRTMDGNIKHELLLLDDDFCKMGTITGFGKGVTNHKNFGGSSSLYYRRSSDGSYWLIAVADDLSFYHISNDQSNVYYVSDNYIEFKVTYNDVVVKGKQNKQKLEAVHGYRSTVSEKQSLVREFVIEKAGFLKSSSYDLNINTNSIEEVVDPTSKDHLIINKLCESGFEKLAFGHYSVFESDKVNFVELYYKVSKDKEDVYIIQVDKNSIMKESNVRMFHIHGDLVKTYTMSEFDFLNYFVDENSPAVINLEEIMNNSAYYNAIDGSRVHISDHELIRHEGHEVIHMIKEIGFKHVGYSTEGRERKYYAKPTGDGGAFVVVVDMERAKESNYINENIKWFYTKELTTILSFATGVKNLIDAVEFYSTDQYKSMLLTDLSNLKSTLKFFNNKKNLIVVSEPVQFTDTISAFIINLGGYQMGNIVNSAGIVTNKIYVCVDSSKRLYVIDRNLYDEELIMYRMYETSPNGYDLKTNDLNEMVSLLTI